MYVGSVASGGMKDAMSSLISQAESLQLLPIFPNQFPTKVLPQDLYQWNETGVWFRRKMKSIL